MAITVEVVVEPAVPVNIGIVVGVGRLRIPAAHPGPVRAAFHIVYVLARKFRQSFIQQNSAPWTRDFTRPDALENRSAGGVVNIFWVSQVAVHPVAARRILADPFRQLRAAPNGVQTLSGRPDVSRQAARPRLRPVVPLSNQSARRRIHVTRIAEVHSESSSQGHQVVSALAAVGKLPALPKQRNANAQKYADDGDDEKDFDEGDAVIGRAVRCPPSGVPDGGQFRS